MIIKNTGSKVINIGTTVLMPDAETKISDSAANTPAIKAFVKRGYAKLESEPAADTEVETKEEVATETKAEAVEKAKEKVRQRKSSTATTVSEETSTETK